MHMTNWHKSSSHMQSSTMYIYKKRAIGCLSWATFKLLSVYTKYWKMEYPPPIPRIEITSTLWINVSLYKNISIPQWDSMTKMIGQVSWTMILSCTWYLLCSWLVIRQRCYYLGQLWQTMWALTLALLV
jgi:hypothetical protein